MSDQAVSPRRRREVLDALRRGTVPAAGLDLLAVGLERAENEDAVEALNEGILAIAGETDRFVFQGAHAPGEGRQGDAGQQSSGGECGEQPAEVGVVLVVVYGVRQLGLAPAP